MAINAIYTLLYPEKYHLTFLVCLGLKQNKITLHINHLIKILIHRDMHGTLLPLILLTIEEEAFPTTKKTL